MSSLDYFENCIMIVFLCWLPDHHIMFATCWWIGSVNFVVMSFYEMSTYHADLV
jgi:hypothetical protein